MFLRKLEAKSAAPLSSFSFIQNVGQFSGMRCVCVCVWGGGGGEENPWMIAAFFAGYTPLGILRFSP